VFKMISPLLCAKKCEEHSEAFLFINPAIYVFKKAFSEEQKMKKSFF